MKKLFLALFAALVFSSSLFSEAPVYDNPKAFIIDTQSLAGELKDNVKLTNVSLTHNFEVAIYGWHEVRNEWLEFGKTRLYGIGDKQTVKSVDRYNRALSSFRYIALVPNSDNEFKYSTVIANKDLNIWFYDNRKIDESHFKVFDLTLLPPVSDNLKIVAGKKFSAGASFKIEVYNDDSEENKTGTIAVLKGPKASETYAKTSNGKKYGSFHYIKIISREEKDFKYIVNVSHNDLIITVEEF